MFLGISPAHDSSICSYKDGKIKSFYKEERITRIKRQSNPVESLKNFKEEKFEAIAWCPPTEDFQYRDYFVSEIEKNNISTKYFIDFSGEHHLMHSSLAFYNSGFEKAIVIVVDRNGSIYMNSCRESESIFVAEYPGNFTPIYKNFWIYDNFAHEAIQEYKKNNPECEVEARSMFGIVKVYESATSLINQHSLENGKVMGLASYGKKSDFENLFVKNNIANDFYFGHRQIFENRAAINQEIDHLNTHKIDKENYQFYANYAYHVQQQTQEAVASLIEKAIKKTRIKNICITGGYALNVVANQYYLKCFPELNFYFEPLADDSGNSVGGAMYVYRDFTKDKKIYKLQNTFFNGQNYKKNNFNGHICEEKEIAQILSKGKSVAIYNEKSEAGPRSLGNRSILFDPRKEDGKKIVNKIKKREWYRPFAASVLEEDAHEYFDMLGIKSSSFMTISFDAKPHVSEMFPSIIHVDNTCRIQTVSKEILHFYKILQEFKKITGHGILLNTSFNLAGDPLVETPQDALETLKKSDLEYIWFADTKELVFKEDI